MIWTLIISSSSTMRDNNGENGKREKKFENLKDENKFNGIKV